MFQLLKKTNIDFMKWKNLSFAVSAVLITLGIVGLVQIGRGKANLGIDFVGGTTIQLRFKQPVAIDKARAALEKSGFPGASIQKIGEEENNILIRLRETEGASDKVQATFSREFPDNAFEVYSVMEIGPAIGQALQRDSLLAIAVSMIAIIIYIAFRFQFKFGVTAAFATMHDVLPYPVGPVQCRPPGSRLHQKSNNQQRDAEGNHEAQRRHEIEHSLHFFVYLVALVYLVDLVSVVNQISLASRINSTR